MSHTSKLPVSKHDKYGPMSKLKAVSPAPSKTHCETDEACSTAMKTFPNEASKKKGTNFLTTKNAYRHAG